MADGLKAKDKVENPKPQFDKPKEIPQDKALSQQEKKKALNTWEQDERQLLTASNKGMSGSDEGLQSVNAIAASRRPGSVEPTGIVANSPRNSSPPSRRRWLVRKRRAVQLLT
jgi:hypothetical protein